MGKVKSKSRDGLLTATSFNLGRARFSEGGQLAAWGWKTAGGKGA